eukprot:EG_transcript_14328
MGDENYRIKRISHFDKTIGIICQNSNGPCPLIALCNVLLLKGLINIHPDHAIVTFSHLSNLLVDYLVDANIVGQDNANLAYNVNDVIGFMPSLQYGLDVNVKFSSIVDFEFTQNHLVFDLLNVRLVHGWLVDPQDATATKVIGALSYNLLVERVIRMREIEEQQGAEGNQEQASEATDALVHEGHVIEAFLSQSAGQLTYHGLLKLHEDVREGELCVLFRNNHFSTLFRYQGELFTLVTDVGYINERVTWEKLCEIDGDNVFVDSEFRVPQPRSSTPAPVVQQQDQETADRMLALRLAQQDATPPPSTAEVAPGFRISEAQMRQQHQIMEQIQQQRASPTQPSGPPRQAITQPSQPEREGREGRPDVPQLQPRLGYTKEAQQKAPKKGTKCTVM